MLVGLLWLAGCERFEEADSGAAGSPDSASVGTAPALDVVDDAGRSWTFDAPPERIVSLVPSTTGILRELGLGDWLVARTDFDEHPSLDSLPSVGGGLNPSPERLLAVDPELVIRFGGPTDRATPDLLDRVGIPHLAVRPDTIGDVLRIVQLVADVTGVPERGRELRESIRARLDSVRSAVADRERPRVVFLLGGDPPWVAGADTFLDELVRIAGGENVFGDVGPLYAPVSIEEVLRREPELLLATEGARVPPALAGLALRRVPESVQSPGVEVGRSAATLARILHGEPER